MRAKQSATITARSCQLEILNDSAGLVKLRCRAASPTPTPTSTPTIVPTSTPIPSANISVSPPSLSVIVNGSVGSFTVTNNSTTVTATNIQATLPSGWNDVVQDSTNCASVAPGASCLISISPGSTTHAQSQIEIQGSNTSVTTALLAVDPVPSTTITASVSNLALSVNDVGLNAALTGNPRIITVTNVGSNSALSITFGISPALPAGTIINSTCSDLAASSSCTLTITPGSNPSAVPSDTNPTPIVLTISGSNTNTITSNVHVLTYGSVFQGGYVFAVDDSTPDSGSISGKVVSLTDQSTGIAWDPGCSGACAGAISANSDFDGAANSLAILNVMSSMYAANTYAAGLCSMTIGGYSDWYLPGICEMSYGDNPGSSCGEINTPTLQNIQSNIVDNAIVSLTDIYWSSTQLSGDPTAQAIFDLFAVPGFQGGDFKELNYFVRCVRSLSQ